MEILYRPEYYIGGPYLHKRRALDSKEMYPVYRTEEVEFVDKCVKC